MKDWSLSFGQKGALAPLWTIRLDNLSLLAGMMAVSSPILLDLNQEYLFRTEADLSPFQLLENYEPWFIEASSVGKLREGEYGLWLRGSQFYRYSLFRFRDAAFLQGLISLCHNFSVDFRNYLYGLPFDSDGKKYLMNGYLLSHNYTAQIVPDDPLDEEEDLDNENLLEPYRSLENTVEWETMDFSDVINQE